MVLTIMIPEYYCKGIAYSTILCSSTNKTMYIDGGERNEDKTTCN